MIRVIIGKNGYYRVGDYIHKNEYIYKVEDKTKVVDELKHPAIVYKNLTELEYIQLCAKAIMHAIENGVKTKYSRL